MNESRTDVYTFIFSQGYHHEANIQGGGKPITSFLQGRCHKIFCFRFFQESSSLKPLKITLGSFRIFLKICGDIRKSRCTTGINYTGSKFATGTTCVVDTSGRFASGVNDTRSKFVTGVNDTGGKLPPVTMTQAANLPSVSITPVANNGSNIRLQTP